MKKNVILFAAVLAGTAMVGCGKETVDGSNIKTPGIAALIDVTATSESLSTVHVDLVVGGSSSNTYVILPSGDKLVATAGTDRKDMSSEGSGEYEAEFATAAGGTEFTVLLDRGAEEDAPNNRGVLPEPFTLGALPTTSPSRATDDITITWDKTDTASDMNIKVEGSCIFIEDIDVAGDSGKHTIPKGTLRSTGGDMPESCDVEVTLTRSRTGSADAIFDKESRFVLNQVRSGKFTSAP